MSKLDVDDEVCDGVADGEKTDGAESKNPEIRTGRSVTSSAGGLLGRPSRDANAKADCEISEAEFAIVDSVKKL